MYRKCGVALALLLLTAATAATADKKQTPKPIKQSPPGESAREARDVDRIDEAVSELVIALEPTDRNSQDQPARGRTISVKDAIDDAIEKEQERVRQIALSYLGTPYRWGGTTPNAFDCSGFTRYVYAEVGIQLPRTARQQYREGDRVKAGYWETGDLVFFDMSKGYVSHVGMYLDNHSFVHASSPKTGVRIDTLKKKSYKKHYVGARRYDLS